MHLFLYEVNLFFPLFHSRPPSPLLVRGGDGGPCTQWLAARCRAGNARSGHAVQDGARLGLRGFLAPEPRDGLLVAKLKRPYRTQNRPTFTPVVWRVTL
jgi:hypothetical protein